MDMGRVRGTLVVNKCLPTLMGKKIRVVEEVDPRDTAKPGCGWTCTFKKGNGQDHG